jgi:hypothetical protein
MFGDFFARTVSIHRKTENLPQIIQPVQQKGDMLLTSTQVMHVLNRSAVDKPIGQEIRNRIHPDHSRCQKCSVLLHKHSPSPHSNVHIHKLKFLFGSGANLKPITLNTSADGIFKVTIKPSTSFV